MRQLRTGIVSSPLNQSGVPIHRSPRNRTTYGDGTNANPAATPTDSEWRRGRRPSTSPPSEWNHAPGRSKEGTWCAETLHGRGILGAQLVESWLVPGGGSRTRERAFRSFERIFHGKSRNSLVVLEYPPRRLATGTIHAPPSRCELHIAAASLRKGGLRHEAIGFSGVDGKASVRRSHRLPMRTRGGTP